MKRVKPATPTSTQQLGRLAVADGDVDVGLPQVELGQLARAIVRCAGRGRAAGTAARSSATRSRSTRIESLPADALGDHRRRHVRELPQQLADLRLDRVDDRALPRPLVARRRRRAQRRPHRVAGHAQPAGDGLDAHPLGPVEPTDLGPVLHVDHPSCSLARIRPGSEFHHRQWWTRGGGVSFRVPIGGQFSRAADSR